MVRFRPLVFILFLFIFLQAPLQAAETSLLRYSGAPIAEPHWFKESFLELEDDIAEAEEAGKKLLIYFHQAGCPYCFNLVQQSFLDPVLSLFIKKHFDVIALDLWGDREVTLPDGQILTEKELAILWKVQYTPTLVFFSGDPEPIVRIDGYRNKEMLAKIFDYVISGDTSTSLAQSLIVNKQGVEKELYPSSLFGDLTNLSQFDLKTPIAILFEYPGCADCDQLHRQVLSRRDTHILLQHYETFRVNLSEPQLIVTPEGVETTAQKWADELGLSYFPSMLLLDEKHIEKFRVDAYVQAYHFNTALDYVRLKKYLEFPEFQRYVNERADQLRSSGVKVIITE